MFAALLEHEASLDENGLPLDEVFSKDADPDNPNGKYRYDVKVLRNWATDAVEQREKDFEGNPSRARRFYPVRVDR